MVKKTNIAQRKVGDTVYILDGNEIKKGKITKVIYEVEPSDAESGYYEQEIVFSSKEELIKSLQEQAA